MKCCHSAKYFTSASKFLFFLTNEITFNLSNQQLYKSVIIHSFYYKRTVH